MLAALLIRRSAALLLDEPTNHLDDDGIAFLEARLRELPGAVVVASHDRVLLDEVCTEQEQLRALRFSVAQTAREVGKFRPIKDNK
ncbi:MAG: hypothetical protein ACRDSR_06710 [Pseudonocardiaceae bacterium]